MKRQEKMDAVTRLLKQGGGRFTAAALEKEVGSHRKARSALFLSRQNGLKLKAERHDKNNGRVVTSYVEVS